MKTKEKEKELKGREDRRGGRGEEVEELLKLTKCYLQSKCQQTAKNQNHMAHVFCSECNEALAQLQKDN